MVPRQRRRPARRWRCCDWQRRAPDSRSAAARDLVAELIALTLALDAVVASTRSGIRRTGSSSPASEPRVQWFFPHDNESGYWWQGENARLASLATLLLAAAEAMPDRDWAPPAR